MRVLLKKLFESRSFITLWRRILYLRTKYISIVLRDNVTEDKVVPGEKVKEFQILILTSPVHPLSGASNNVLKQLEPLQTFCIVSVTIQSRVWRMYLCIDAKTRSLYRSCLCYFFYFEGLRSIKTSNPTLSSHIVTWSLSLTLRSMVGKINHKNSIAVGALLC